jgi:hypothetical protein
MRTCAHRVCCLHAGHPSRLGRTPVTAAVRRSGVCGTPRRPDKSLTLPAPRKSLMAHRADYGLRSLACDQSDLARLTVEFGEEEPEEAGRVGQCITSDTWWTGLLSVSSARNRRFVSSRLSRMKLFIPPHSTQILCCWHLHARCEA